MNKFIEIEPSDDIAKKNQWLVDCRQKNMPYVVVNLRGKTAEVEWDYISYPMGAEKQFEQKESCLRAECQKIYDKYSTKGSTFSISASVVNFSGFSIQDAKVAAEEIFDLVEKLINSKACELQSTSLG